MLRVVFILLAEHKTLALLSLLLSLTHPVQPTAKCHTSPRVLRGLSDDSLTATKSKELCVCVHASNLGICADCVIHLNLRHLTVFHRRGL